MKLSIQIHSFVDLITNSSTEIFLLNTSRSLEMVDTIIKWEVEKLDKAGHAYAKEWLDRWYKISYKHDGSIEVYSGLNLPDEIEHILLNNLNAIYV